MKNTILESKPAALAAFILIIILLVATFSLRGPWWTFIDIFFLFMMAFTHLIAATTASRNRYAASRLDKIACVCGIAGVVAFIAEWIIFQQIMAA